jgi:hypothetical protein
MKLHIECLQEKLDQTQKDMDAQNKMQENEVLIINNEKKKYIQKIGSLELEITTIKAKMVQADKIRDQVINDLKIEKIKHTQKMTQLEQRLNSSIEQNKMMS